MKKTLLTGAAAALMALQPQQAGAQFLEKVTKALNSVESQIDDALGTSLSGQTTTSADGTKTYSRLKGLTVKYLGLTWHDGVWGIDFTVRNGGGEAVTVYHFNNTSAIDGNNTLYSCRCTVGGVVAIDGRSAFSFKPGQTVMCRLDILNLPATGAIMKMCQLRLQMPDGGKALKDSYLEFSNVTVPRKPQTAG